MAALTCSYGENYASPEIGTLNPAHQISQRVLYMNIYQAILLLQMMPLRAYLSMLGRDTDSNPSIVTLSLKRTPADGTVINAVQSTFFKAAMAQALLNLVLKLHVANGVSTRMLINSTVTVSETVFVKEAVQRSLFTRRRL